MKQIMDEMDIDHIVDVPDTPDRLAAQKINQTSNVKEEDHRPSIPRHSLQQNLFENGSKEQPMVIDGGSRGLSLHPPKYSSSSSNSRHPNNAHVSRKGVTEKNISHRSHDPIHAQHPPSVRPSYVPKPSSFQDDSFVDLTERNMHRPFTGNASPSGMPGCIRYEFRKKSGLSNGVSSFHNRQNFSTASCNTNEKTDSASGVGSSTACGESMEFVDNIQKKPVNNGFVSHGPVVPPKVNKQKRLVRNGCISPNNIAKAKQLSGKDINGSVAVACHNNGSMESSAPPVSIAIRELVAEDSDSYTGKGKGVVTHPCSSNGPDFKNKNLHSRSSMGFNEDAVETSGYIRGAGKSTEESGGWRSTRNRTREMDMLSPDKERYLVRETDTPISSSQHHENRLERRGKGISNANGDDHPKGTNMISSENVRTQPSKESVSRPRAHMGRLNGPRSAADTLIKRQKQGSTSSRYGECSTSVSADPEVVFLRSSEEAANPKSSSCSMENLQQIIEVDEFSPQLRRNDHDEDARARQVEADERMARELQEQLYSEVPAFEIAEVDENIALALQNQDDLGHGLSRARRPVLDARVLMSNLRRQSESRSSSNVTRRGSLARASTLGRTRLRNRFPGQPRTILPTRGGASLFPADMDVDMRMHILGALEDLNHMEMSTGILQAHRDFNENDYEMLLALDENNDRHAGASIYQINALPQSTVQTDNFEEACAICLDTPAIGDTIRHLPCLHKFHKDCIDPWLRRRTSCPVCKSSVT